MSNTASYIGKEPTYGVFISQAETGDGSTVAFSLDATANTTQSLLVSVGGVLQQPLTAYNVNSTGTTLTFTAAPGSSIPIWILYLGQTLTVPQASSANTTMITALSALGTAPASGDYFLLYDADAAAMKKLAYSNLETGDISNVIAGSGMTGGGTSGAVTLNVIGGTGITANADDVAIDSTVTTLTGSQTLTNKSLTAPTITGAPTAAGATWADLGAVTTIDINSGTVDAVIGGTTPAAGTFTQVDITAQGDLRLQDTTGGEHIALQAAGTTTTYTLTLPAAVATVSGQALTSTTGGVASWTTITTDTSGAWTSGTATTGKALVMGF